MASRELKVSDAIVRRLKEIAGKLGNGSVSVGFLEGATYADGTPVASVAFWNEYGHGGSFPSPPRPFFRAMIAKESPTWADKMGNLAIVTNNDGPKVLALMGEDIQGALIQSINDLTEPALSPTTLALRKKFGNQPEKITFEDVLQAQKDASKPENLASGTQAKPLIWTGHMVNSTGYEVKR